MSAVRRKRPGAGVLLILVLMVGVAILFFNMDRAEGPLETAVDYAADDRWSEALASGKEEVEFSRALRSESDKRTKLEDRLVLGRFRSLGALTPNQKARVRRVFQQNLSLMERKYISQVQKSTQDGATSPLEFEYEEGRRLDVARFEVALQQLDEDSYWAFPGGVDSLSTQVPRFIPRGWEYMVTSNAARTADGEPIDIVSAMDPEKYPTLKQALDGLRAVRKFRMDDEVLRINSLPISERREIILSHLAAGEQLHSDEMHKLGEADPVAWEAKYKEISKRMIQTPVTVDRSTYTVYRQR